MSENLTFEQALEKLEEIVQKLESGCETLDDSIKLFEEGMQLADRVDKELDCAEKKIVKLINKNGELKEEPFIPQG